MVKLYLQSMVIDETFAIPVTRHDGDANLDSVLSALLSPLRGQTGRALLASYGPDHTPRCEQSVAIDRFESSGEICVRLRLPYSS